VKIMAWLNFLDSMEFLKSNEIEVPDYQVIRSRKELEAQKWLPCVLKLSSGLLHKTEEHAVITDIYSKEELFSAYDKLRSVLEKQGIKGEIVLQRQIKGIELIIGVSSDQQFGKVILFGQGGIYTEILDDTSIRLLPVTKKDIEEMVFSTKVSKLFSARGKTYDTKKLVALVEDVSRVSKKLLELDLNPVILTEDGVYIVDARVNLEDRK